MRISSRSRFYSIHINRWSRYELSGCAICERKVKEKRRGREKLLLTSRSLQIFKLRHVLENVNFVGKLKRGRRRGKNRKGDDAEGTVVIYHYSKRRLRNWERLRSCYGLSSRATFRKIRELKIFHLTMPTSEREVVLIVVPCRPYSFTLPARGAFGRLCGGRWHRSAGLRASVIPPKNNERTEGHWTSLWQRKLRERPTKWRAGGGRRPWHALRARIRGLGARGDDGHELWRGNRAWMRRWKSHVFQQGNAHGNEIFWKMSSGRCTTPVGARTDAVEHIALYLHEDDPEFHRKSWVWVTFLSLHHTKRHDLQL